jgi:hypothetical protein
MELNLSKNLCVFFGVTNLILFAITGHALNVIIGVLMFLWAFFLEFFYVR